jgi:2-isopropylmalate synthase
MIEQSVAYLKRSVDEVIFDAEHFFDGYKNHPEYAVKALEAALNGGASWLVLCDTNGGCLPLEYHAIVEKMVARFGSIIGVHNHNDTGCGDANSIVGVQAGATQVQGTINGIGERCGNANLCSVIANLELKLGRHCIGRENLKKLTETAMFVSEVANIHHNSHLPYVGQSSFAHKGGAHIDGMLKSQMSFEHIDPEWVGNERLYVLSDQSGTATVVEKLKKYYPNIDKSDVRVREILNKVKKMESDGYQFEVAEASFRLLAQREIEGVTLPFTIQSYRVIEEKKAGVLPVSEATIQVIADGRRVHTAAEGDGPVNALDNALRKALLDFYPVLADMHLTDYKVLVIEGRNGTAAKVRVLIQSGDGQEVWGTVGVSENIIEASWIALIDSIQYKLAKSGILY